MERNDDIQSVSSYTESEMEHNEDVQSLTSYSGSEYVSIDKNMLDELIQACQEFKKLKNIVKDSVMRLQDEITTIRKDLLILKASVKFGVALSEDEVNGDSCCLLADGQKTKEDNVSMFASQKTNVKLTDVVGLEAVKSALNMNIVLPTNFPKLFKDQCRPWKGILLYGPPGTGKSHLVKAIANEASKSTFFSLSASNIVSKWLGQSEQRVRQLFEQAKEKQPSIIFIDEIDSLCFARSENENDSTCCIKAELMVQMQAIEDDDKVIVVGATSTPWVLDSAFCRRFEKRYYVSLPNKDERTELIRLKLNKKKHNLTEKQIKSIASSTEGYSFHDLDILINDALGRPIRKITEATHFRQVNGPSGGGSVNTEQKLWAPCKSSDRGAKKISLRELGGVDFDVPTLTEEDVRTSLRSVAPKVKREELMKLMEFDRNFGSIE
ncbi:hypothetical protein WR25_04971 [Diploscapter pachys]|uniref:AAA+ ATPase domain-containing protein n=1 Tax=Diploscapter pachys TaxID=2018661 RepID=A0A2A2K2S1_9BILA|nr:hypothetical protein WR25_04971 [Diploscapter pachys]